MGLTLIIRLSLSSNWTELDWTGTELGNKGRETGVVPSSGIAEVVFAFFFERLPQ